MKRSKFTDEQILAIVKEGKAGRKVADLCRAHEVPVDAAGTHVVSRSDVHLLSSGRLSSLAVTVPASFISRQA